MTRTYSITLQHADGTQDERIFEIGTDEHEADVAEIIDRIALEIMREAGGLRGGDYIRVRHAPDPSTVTPLNERQKTALDMMKSSARSTFQLCAETAEDMAARVDRGELPMDSATALRLLASMFMTSASKD